MNVSASQAPFPGLGERLRRLRTGAATDGAELSARELDRLAGIARGYTSMLESGERTNPAAWVVTNLADALGCTTDWLLRALGTEPTEEEVRAAVAAARERCAKRDHEEGN
jgi:transcriptional regulator with XRE-family HTH domain